MITGPRVWGVCKTSRPPGMEDDATVEDIGGNQWTVPKSDYIAKGYQPPFDNLPPCNAGTQNA